MAENAKCPKCCSDLAELTRDHVQFCVPGFTIADWLALARAPYSGKDTTDFEAYFLPPDSEQ